MWLALLFQWGIAFHDVHLDESLAGRQSFAVLRRRAAPVLRKAGWQLAKDYLVFPALALWNAPRVALGNLFANGIRNLWAFAVIFFCAALVHPRRRSRTAPGATSSVQILKLACAGGSACAEEGLDAPRASLYAGM